MLIGYFKSLFERAEYFADIYYRQQNGSEPGQLDEMTGERELDDRKTMEFKNWMARRSLK